MDKREDLELLIAKYAPLVICLQETFLSKEIEINQNNKDKLPSKLNFKGYKPYFKCIDSGRNGIAIYVKNGVWHHPIYPDTNLQAIAV